MFSKYEIYTTAQSIYCYKGTNVLKNKLGIKESSLLREAEEEITAIKQMQLLQQPIAGDIPKLIYLIFINLFLKTFIHSQGKRGRNK